MSTMNGMTLYHKIKEIDNSVLICFTTTNKNYIEDLRKGLIDIDKIVLYKPILLKDLTNKIDSLLFIDCIYKELFLSIYYLI
jgi:two-component SAPR family response regulator